MPQTAAYPNLTGGGFLNRVPASLSPRGFHTGGAPYTGAGVTGTDGWAGNNNTPVTTETYMCEVLVTHTCIVSGIAIKNGSVASTNKVALAILDVAGTVLGNTDLTGTLVANANIYQAVPLTAPIQLRPGTYWVAMQYNGNTARFSTHTLGRFGAGKATGTVFGTFTGLTPPASFTTNLGPIASLY